MRIYIYSMSKAMAVSATCHEVGSSGRHSERERERERESEGEGGREGWREGGRGKGVRDA